ncbi:hypothetical protein [Capillimicrobium parvum]|uniref:Uncharacterized protein n=1 Tax=Capillimicrobium parvum TaxID=2884022 RepID=A0A9E6XZG6_9ACTN|nr:hypothetical protein [Capillimicrobium parvum]UGS36878.1 hypothetical protein DSM104329_03289 [Capillimicrobium parvum]
MRLASVLVGDIVLVNRKGRVFHALVTGIELRGLGIEPIDKRVTYRQCSAHDVVGHWARRGRPQAGDEELRPTEAQLSLGV